MGRSEAITRVILELADLQHGIVARRQLLTRGIPARTITNRINNSNLFTVFAGVYLVGRRQLTREGLPVAALLAAGDGAVLGARTAAAVWGFLDHQNPIEVFRTHAGRNQRARIRVEGENWWPYLLVHEPRDLPASEVTSFRGLPLTSPARTLRDIAAGLSEKRFHLAFLEADRRELLDDQALVNCANRTQGRKGAGRFRRSVDRRIPNIREARSLLEAIVMDLYARKLIPAPEVNRKAGRYRPDFKWPTNRVLVEADGYEFHRGREAFEDDILRANRLRAEGWTVLRFTWRMVTEKPDEVAEMIRRTLSDAEPPAKAKPEAGAVRTGK